MGSRTCQTHGITSHLSGGKLIHTATGAPCAGRAETLPDGCEAHGIPAYRDDAGTVHIATGARCIGPDLDRDVRVAVRRAADARRASRALDGLLTAPWSTGFEAGYAAGFQAGAESASYRPVAHKSDYVAPGMPDGAPGRAREAAEKLATVGQWQASSACGPACARLHGVEHTHSAEPGVTDEWPMHYCADDDRTACGKFAGMVYQYASIWQSVTCRECWTAVSPA